MSHLHAKMPMHPVHTLRAAGDPKGLPRTSIHGLEKHRNNCWVAASVAFLVNDPLIIMFACETFTSSGKLREMCIDTERDREFRKYHTEERLTALALLKCIALIHHAPRTMSEDQKNKLLRASTKLYGQKRATVSDETRDDPTCMGSANEDGYRHDMYILQLAMQYWWTEPESRLFAGYGIQAHLDTHFRCGECGTFKTQSSKVNDFDMFTVNAPPATETINLQHELTDKILNATSITPASKSAMLDEHHKAACSRKTAEKAKIFEHTTVASLPWRFGVRINRQFDTEKKVVLNQDAIVNTGGVCYDPRALLLGPTVNGALWGNYRLVGRLVHATKHWTTTILPLGSTGHSIAYKDKDRELSTPWPVSFKHFSWDEVTDCKVKYYKKADTKVPLANEIIMDNTTCVDRNAVMLIFERYE